MISGIKIEDLRRMPEGRKIELYETALKVEAFGLSRDFRAYLRAAWPIVEPTTRFVEGWHIDAIADHLTAVSRGEIRNLLINIPPGHMKSLEVCVFWPTWEWTSAAWLRYVVASYSEEFATRDSLKSRRIIQSEWYRERWGDGVRLSGDQNLKMRYENTATGYRISGGLSHTGERGDRLVVDDPHKITEAESEVARESVLTWWDQVMSQRGTDPKTVARVVIMQRLHELDLSGHLLKQGGWDHLCLPAEYEAGQSKRSTSIGWSDPRKDDGELLWPARFGPTEIASAKVALGSYGAAGQLQQHPVPAGGGMVKLDWFKFWRELPLECVAACYSVDCSFKETIGSSFVVIQYWRRTGSGFYLVDQVRAQMGYVATRTAIRGFVGRYGEGPAVLVEDKANGTAILDDLKLQIPGLVPVTPHESKEARFSSVSPFFEAGNVFLPDPSFAPWVNDYMTECVTFPAGATDDQVDATSQALAWMRVRGQWTAEEFEKSFAPEMSSVVAAQAHVAGGKLIRETVTPSGTSRLEIVG